MITDGVVQNGEYIIQNDSVTSLVTLKDGTNESEIFTSNDSDSDHVKWVVTKNGDNRTYTIQNKRWNHYAFVTPQPTSGAVVKSRQKPYNWIIKTTYTPGHYFIHSTESDTLVWKFENGNTGTRLRLSDTDEPGWTWTFTRVTENSTPSYNTPIAPSTVPTAKMPSPTNTSIPLKNLSTPGPAESKTHDPNSVVFSLNVGTVNSSVSYIGPNNKDTPKAVVNWPKLPRKSIKVRTRIYYKDKKPMFYGSQQVSGAESDYEIVEEFKRRIHGLPTNPISKGESSPLPEGIGIDSVYRHWLAYLFDHAQKEFKRDNKTESAWNERLVIFTIPNGWTAAEQTLLSKVIVEAKWVSSIGKVRFINESDAGIHFLSHKNQTLLKEGKELVICDAGGSTIDVAMYRVVKGSPVEIAAKENSPPLSIDANLSEAYARASDLSGNFADNEEEGDDATEAQESNEELNANIGIIIGAIDKVINNNLPSLLILKGGFCQYDPVEEKLSDTYASKMEVFSPGSEVDEVADGALYCHLNNALVSHSVALSYGCAVLVPYKDNIPDIANRTVIPMGAGGFVEDGWHPIVSCGDILPKGASRVMPYYKAFSRRNAKLSNIEIDLYAADDHANKHWVRDSEGDLMPHFYEISKIHVDLSALERKLPKVERRGREPYYKLQFDIVLEFNSISLQAKVVWKEKVGDQEVSREKIAVLGSPPSASQEFTATA